MPEIQKLTDDEKKTIFGLQKRFSLLLRQLGERMYQKKVADAELRLAEKALEDFDAERFTIIKQMQDKYGVGHINIETGEFLPDK